MIVDPAGTESYVGGQDLAGSQGHAVEPEHLIAAAHTPVVCQTPDAYQAQLTKKSRLIGSAPAIEEEVAPRSTTAEIAVILHVVEEQA